MLGARASSVLDRGRQGEGRWIAFRPCGLPGREGARVPRVFAEGRAGLGAEQSVGGVALLFAVVYRCRPRIPRFAYISPAAGGS